MIWINSRVWPPLARFTASTSRREAGEKAVVADAQQRTAGDVANAGRLDDDRARATARETLVPGDDVVGDEAVLGRAPGHHRGNPGALLDLEPPDFERRKQARARRFLARGRAPRRGGESDALGGTPHRAIFRPQARRSFRRAEGKTNLRGPKVKIFSA